MPPDNAEVVRSLYVRFEQGDVDGFLAALDPAIDWRSPATLPWSYGAHAGVDEVAAYIQRMAGSWATVRVELDEILDAGDDVVALCRMVGTLPGADEPIELPTAHRWKLRDGRPVAMHAITDAAPLRLALAAEEAR